MMEYITAKPRTLTATETRLLRSIESAGWWSIDARCLSYDDQEALEFLWRSGYIERKAYGGWGMKGSAKPTPTDAETIRALLAEHGITPARPIVECKDIRKRPGPQPSWAIELAPGARIPPEVWAKLQPGCWRSGNLYVVQVRE